MVKWKNPKNGGCQYYEKDGYRYYIIDRMFSDGSISSYWHIERKKILQSSSRRKFESFREMLLSLFGKCLADGESESVAYWEIRSKTDYINCGNDYTRVFEKDGKHFAVNLQTKESWEYAVAETVSPDLETVEDCKRYADEEIFKPMALF